MTETSTQTIARLKAEASHELGTPNGRLKAPVPEGAVKRGRGRPKGTPNQQRDKLLKMVTDVGCPHPLVGLATIAKDAIENEDPMLAKDTLKELAQYIVPKLKSVEYKAPGKDTIQPITIVMPAQD
jgi:hypothetical protein